MRDDCDPAHLRRGRGSGTCVGDGDTLFQDFIDEVLGTGSAEKWRFNSDRTEADRAVNAENRGGETHSFTEVNHFGGGFIPVLNGGQVPLVECAARDQNGALIPDGKGNFVPALPAILSFVPSGAAATPSRSRGHPQIPVLHPPVDAVDGHRQIDRRERPVESGRSRFPAQGNSLAPRRGRGAPPRSREKSTTRRAASPRASCRTRSPARSSRARSIRAARRRARPQSPPDAPAAARRSRARATPAPRTDPPGESPACRETWSSSRRTARSRPARRRRSR